MRARTQVVPHVVLPHPVPALPTKLFSPITDRKSLDSWDSSTHEDNFATERKPEHIPKSRRSSDMLPSHLLTGAQMAGSTHILVGHHLPSPDTSAPSRHWSLLNLFIDDIYCHSLGAGAPGIGDYILITCATQGRFDKGYLDIALEDVENARVNLAEENDVLRKLVVDCVNGAQGLLHRIKYRGDERHMVDEPTPVTEAQLFPLAPMNATREAFTLGADPYLPGRQIEGFLRVFQQFTQILPSGLIVNKFKTYPPLCPHFDQWGSAPSVKGILHAVGDTIEKRPDNIPDPSDSRNADVAKLNAIVQHLRNEPDQARCHTSDYASQARSLVDKFIKGQDSSRVLSSSPDVDSETTSIEKRRLQAERDELDEDRRNLTEAALKLGRERAALEVQRLEFLEDRRAWDVKKMIDDLPPSPKATGAPMSSTVVKSALKEKLASPSRRKSTLFLPFLPAPAMIDVPRFCLEAWVFNGISSLVPLPRK
ncbi:hypothetical protein BJ322DRAFT_1195087 [Thelephora terrestris]|uniref:Uncharacterized protein n=1 Tax=Thelephora terrestris TaxID=56493 RepID=A0A9P6HFU2_9AGAM|nr:hypothetical protein BJ322DRAFT_1195087 [Thelephora terrestris]